MLWDEEKGEWITVTKESAIEIKEDKENARRAIIRSSYAEEWARYLPSSVRSGKREATDWEVWEAKRKLYAKEMLTVRAMKRAEDRRQLIEYRKATGWYSNRSRNAFAPGPALRIHMNSSGYGY